MGHSVIVDPGVNGGIVIALDKEVVQVLAMPGNMLALAAILNDLPNNSQMFIELVGGYVGGEGQPGSRMFTFGKNDGWFDGYAAARDWKLRRLSPFAWQQDLNIGLANERKDKAAWKRDLRTVAVERFPQFKPTLKTADALLIWEHVRAKLLEPPKTRPVGQVDYKAERIKRLARVPGKA